MLPSKGDKGEGKLAPRIDVLAQRVDTLASTVATTASAMAKHDGEMAALRKELEARDQRLAALIAQPRETAGGDELRELKQAVAALASERSKGSASSKGLDELAGKITLLGQRLETLSATVSTTAAGLAGRDGELAAIRKRLESAPPPGSAVAAADPALHQRLGDLVGDVTSTRLQLQGVTEQIAALEALSEQRAAEESPRLDDEMGALTAEVTDTRQRLGRLAHDVTALKAYVEQQAGEPARPSEEVREMLGALRAQVEQLGELKAGVSDQELGERLARTDESVARVAARVDALATTIDSAVGSIAEKEAELAELHRQFTASSGRIESIVDDIRAALSVIPELDAAGVDDLATRVERMEARGREQVDAGERLTSELSRRLDAMETQVASVANEVARAKALWPVALRSLEARLDDVAGHARTPEAAPESAPETGADDDLLAGLRDSLQAMETVAAEMARASDVLAPTGEGAATHEAIAAAGATIVPLRSSDP